MEVRRVLVAGFMASIVMGMIEMIYEAVAGVGFWASVIFIGATVLRSLQSVQAPVPFNLAGVVLGLMGHMMNSVIFGLIFARIVSLSTMSRTGLVGWGMIYGLAIFLIMWFVIVPAVDPVMLKLNATVFAMSHLMWGAALGLMVPQSSAASARLRTI